MFKKTKKINPLKSLKMQDFIKGINYPCLNTLSETDRVQLLNTLKSKIIEYFSQSIDLSKFKFFYITSGITDGLNYVHNQNIGSNFDIRDGDYEYLSYLQSNTINDNKITYISNPSSIDGNFVEDWDNVLENKRIILDCAYLGTTETKHIKINDNVETVLLGLSKTFGLYENRIGFIFTNKKMHLLHKIIYDNSYYNVMSCILTTQLLENFPLGYIHQLYKNQQLEVCKEYNLNPSDVCFIGTSTDESYSFYKRGNINRLCLSEKMPVM
jgi:hypothetical protein